MSKRLVPFLRAICKAFRLLIAPPPVSEVQQPLDTGDSFVSIAELSDFLHEEWKTRSYIPPAHSEARRYARHFPGLKGICRICGCTDLNGCVLWGRDPGVCRWADKEQTLCTNPDCLQKAAAKNGRAA